MEKTCDTIARDEVVGGFSDQQSSICLRPNAHYGPHMGKNMFGKYILWQVDPCDESDNCSGCASEDTDRWCVSYQEISQSEAEVYLKDGKAVGDSWEV